MTGNLDVTEIIAAGTTGTIPEGAYAIGVINTGAAAGFLSSVDGAGTIPAGTSKTFPACSRTYPVMYYVATGTTLLITIIK